MCGPPGWKNGPILERLSASPARESIRRLAFVSDAELAWLYREADALLFPSLYEGFGLPPLEAATFGTPAFVSDRGALPESAFRPDYVVPLVVDEWVERVRRLTAPSREDLRAHAARFTGEVAADQFLAVAAEAQALCIAR
jgi:glycosyltransferase involved in cell wall biosynthesis